MNELSNNCKIAIKIIVFVIISVAIVMCMPQNSYAADVSPTTVIQGGDQFMQNAEQRNLNSERATSSRFTPAEPIRYEIEDDIVSLKIINVVWLATIMTTFVAWIVCIVSMILNITRRNNGKAIFSGIGILAPIICTFMATLGRILAFLELRTVVGLVMVVTAAIIQVIFIIVPFIFCFSKNKENKPTESN